MSFADDIKEALEAKKKLDEISKYLNDDLLIKLQKANNISDRKLEEINNRILDYLSYVPYVEKILKHEDEIIKISKHIGSIIENANNINSINHISKHTDEISEVYNHIEGIEEVRGLIKYAIDIKKYAKEIKTVADNIEDIKNIKNEISEIKSIYSEIKEYVEEQKKDKTEIINALARIQNIYDDMIYLYKNEVVPAIDTINNLNVITDFVPYRKKSKSRFDKKTNTLYLAIREGKQGEGGVIESHYKPDYVGTKKGMRKYDGYPPGTSYLSIDEEPVMIYFRKSNQYGDWTKGQPFGINSVENMRMTVENSRKLDGHTIDEIISYINKRISEVKNAK